MSERESEFEELLDRTLRRRVNVVAPVEMVGRISEAAGREVVVRRWVPMWQMAVAASVVLVVSGAFYGWRYERGMEHGVAPQIAMREMPSEGVRTMSPAVSIVAPPIPHVVRARAVRRRSMSSDETVGMNEGPKLDMFPSTAMNPPKPEPGSMEAQLQVLISLPQSTLAQMAETQAKEQSAPKAQTDMQDKLN